MVAGTRPLLFEDRERPATLACSPESRTEASVNPTKTKPTVARIWRGRTTRANADAYAAYLYEHGVRRLEEKALGVQQLREDRAEDTEFVTVSYWESVEAMSRFAGPDPRRIHHLERDADGVPDRAAPGRAGAPDHRIEGSVWDLIGGLRERSVVSLADVGTRDRLAP